MIMLCITANDTIDAIARSCLKDAIGYQYNWIG